MTEHRLKSWGQYPDAPQIAHPCHWRSELGNDIERLRLGHGSTLAFGMGRSYGDSCLAASGHVLHMTGLDRFIAVDWQAGIVKAEAGVTLEDVLELAIPKGWFLPVVPGTKYVTLGGAIANDVHGKNHHVKGTFGCHVRGFSLSRSDRAEMWCTRTENENLFAATIGGLGLTGVIGWVELQLMPICSSKLDMTTVRFDSLKEFFELSRTFAAGYEYTAAWLDCLSGPGRGVYMAANHAEQGGLDVASSCGLAFPLTPPMSLLNAPTIKLFNAAYFNGYASAPSTYAVPYARFFFPLDRILHWNRIYGRKGFQQFQCIIPDDTAEAAIQEICTIIAQANIGSFLAVLKRCGDVASPGLMSFPMQGMSLALDFPQCAALAETLFPQMDKIVHAAGGRLYAAKDAHMRGDDFRSAYPAWKQVEALRDPALMSQFWKRVALS